MADRDLDLGWLRVFDAVGRLGGLSRAAEALNLSQPAVSYQIRRLEEQLGVPLLRREHRGVRLSAEGEILFRAVRTGVERIDDAARDIRRRRRTPAVRLFTDYGFAALWLMPRVSDFRRLNPDVEVHIVASQDLGGGLDGSADTAVLFGGASDFPPGARLLIPERAVPVCTPGFLARFGPFDTMAAIAAAPLLHLDSGPTPRWFTWTSWLALRGVRRDPAQGDLGLNTYSLVVQAAVAEQGIALGWSGLVDALLDSGVLVPIGTPEVRSDRGYWLIPGGPTGALIETFNDWLVAECAGRPAV